MNHNAILISSNDSEELNKFMEMNEYNSPWFKHTEFSYSNYIRTESSILHSLTAKSVEFPNIQFKLSFFSENIKFPSAGQYKIFNGAEECVLVSRKVYWKWKKFFRDYEKTVFSKY